MYDPVLQAMVRTLNRKKIAAENAGVTGTDCGLIKADLQVPTVAFNTQGTVDAVHELRFDVRLARLPYSGCS